MPRLNASDAARVRAISADLGVIRTSGPSTIENTLPEIRALLGTESMVVYCPTERAEGWDLERLDLDHFPQAGRFERLFREYLATAPYRFSWFDPIRPERTQRNRVVEGVGVIEKERPGEFAGSRFCQEVFAPIGIDRHRQLRVLVCDGPALLAWVGTFHPDPVDSRQHRILSALVPALLRCLSLERQMRAAPRVFAALEIALSYIGAPAFVLGPRGHLHEVNAAGRAMLAERRQTVMAALRDSVAGHPSELPIDLTPLREGSTPIGWLGILRSDTHDERLAECVRVASAHWGLTPRQREILGLVARGMANATISATLGIGQRAVELQVSALFDRAGVENRAALVGAVFSAALR